MPNRYRPARCRTDGCGAEIEFFRSPYTGSTRAFDARPVDGHDPGPEAFPVWGRTAYRLPVLIELLQVQRECSEPDAEAEARDMPWHAIHQCTPTPTGADATTEKETTHP